MPNIYILLMHTKTIPARLIKFATGYKYSHVAISFDKSCDITYSFGRRKLHSIIGSGFVTESRDGAFFSKFNKTVCTVYEIPVSHSQYDRLKLMISEMELNSQNYKYDYLGICLHFFRIPVIFEHRYVCSHFVASVLERAEICHFDKLPIFVKPKDFENINGSRIIYSGQYRQQNAKVS